MGPEISDLENVSWSAVSDRARPHAKFPQNRFPKKCEPCGYVSLTGGRHALFPGTVALLAVRLYDRVRRLLSWMSAGEGEAGVQLG
jgi:hypothetical protein